MKNTESTVVRRDIQVNRSSGCNYSNNCIKTKINQNNGRNTRHGEHELHERDQMVVKN